MKPPHGSSTEAGSETGRASPSRPSACAARAGRTALLSYRERERIRLRDQGFTTAEEVAEQLDLTPGTVRALGRDRNEPRVERAIISTEGRRYCMFRANCHDEMVSRTVGEDGKITESARKTPQTEQGAS